MRSVLSRSGAFRLINDMNKIVPAARIHRLLTSSQLAVLTRPRYFASGPEGHIRDATDSTFSKKEKAIEDQWIRAQDAEKVKHLREELAKQKKKLKELEENLDELSDKKKEKD
ncbi:uncharacterized protein OCT59_022387 [Rhizophagus irregularis]|uniref:ATPase inhibitor, mitochondrial n=2 Tax=Rhizophagus irregularis TaxID=588596 RepID=A0A015I848_RHIIW|nr:hypothetical protein GLOIN_2v1484109 [Rhizophagus irregularis DAOM 181602=DAOM 197198]EXX53312.1 hypothetical protein RirG_245110 [Rhizophagus irregularis DAOM 197198w]UZO28880.1 hypothetical protein OCT59_022387 [Rhizophagus irregularis]POG64150.1 hypothetical protein GLOIN_2v1484109 [Rhizophagus irregularis DAOM 181602=DAOM 197198]CAG8599150.1 7031_t:CDS:2 [Rhizophagus irregularis]GBC51158.1 ATP synthase inhibitor protein INH1 [Rhizophagus irregularis DAOM 181602=DAOM 197198]|eukprot:XP_025171016.1 hypothetical protein GLOIN_2v1484109 [Rhizophagus irregularis DAOM 181602=DAOM 197198]